MTVQDALRTAHQMLRKAVPGKRRTAHAEEGLLAATFREAMRLWDIQKADGVALSDRLSGLTTALRAAWPQTREWKYLCTSCGDVGLVMADCPGDATCGRHKPHLPHDFGTPCWCSRGVRFKQQPKNTEDALTQVGKTKPSRIGR